MQMKQYTLQILWRVIEENLLEGLCSVGLAFDVVATNVQVEQLTTTDYTSFVAVVDAEPTTHDIPNGITRQMQCFDAVLTLFDVFHNHGFLVWLRRFV